MLNKERLFTPGPTPLSPEVQLAMARPIIHHRTDEFRTIFKASAARLQAFLKTRNDVLFLASSGSGAMEAALVNTLSTGDTMLALMAGSFGERWAAIGEAHGMNVKTLEAEWGEVVSPAAVKAALEADASIRAVFVQLNESSTGAKHDIQGIGAVVATRPDTLLIVDAISGAGAMALETDAWGVDIAVVGSQKALALPPGLVFLSVSERAWKRIETATAPRFYFDLRRERKAQPTGESSFTPPISIIVALGAALDNVDRVGGVDALVENAATLAAMTRAAAKAMGLPLLSETAHGDALTALKPPPGLDASAIVKRLKSEFRSTVAGGQGKLKGQIFRVAHLGYYDATDILGLIGTLEIVLHRLGHKVTPGSGCAAAVAEYLRRQKAS